MLAPLLAALLAAAPAPSGEATAVATAAPAPAASVAEAPVSAADLVRRCVDAYGGPRALLRLARTRAEGTVTSSLHPGEKGRMVRTYERPGRLRLDIRFGAATPDLRVLDGARSWRYGAAGPPAFTAALQLQAARLDLPALLARGDVPVVERAPLVLDGTALRVLALELGPDLTLEAGIDPATGRILLARGLARAGPRALEFLTRFGDFRALDGVLVPMRETSWANGEATGEAVLDRVDFPEDLPDAAFLP